MHYVHEYTTTFPDAEYLRELMENEQRKCAEGRSDLAKLLMYCGDSLNWVADFILDPHVKWEKRVLKLDDLYLTGTTPEWNRIIIDQCERSPQKLRDLLATDGQCRALFSSATWSDKPILARAEEDHLKVFDGMHRVIAGIRDQRQEITAFIGRLEGEKHAPVCEPHVVYDLLRAYIRKLNPDRAGLIAALRFLRKAYSNVDDLLKNRFNFAAVPDQEIQEIIVEAMKNA